MTAKVRICRGLSRFALVLLIFTGFTATAITANEARQVIGAYHSAFYDASGTNGFFKDTQTGGVAYFWGQAEMIECVIDAYEWTTNSIYEAMITNLLNGFLRHNGSNWSGNMYNDDIMWAVIAFARGGQLTGKMNYCDLAKANFDVCFARAWDSKLGGGLYWTTDNNTKNACVNGPGAIAACLLYNIYGDASYLNKARSVYNWERAVLFNPNTGAISDAIETNGVIHTWASTYNQGTFIGAANFLGYTNDATLAANFTMLRLTTGGVLPEYGIAGNNSGFNAIFLRWMNRFIRDRGLEEVYQPWLQLNAEAAYKARRASDNLAWCQWLRPGPLGTNFYAWDCISSYEIMHAAEPDRPSPPLAVPPDETGHWSFDAGQGSTALDSSINANHGQISSAAWSSEGRINGCLVFDGASASVRIPNRLGSDFSIAFWVKTTQPSSAGQWYNGKGLVDADASFTRNDFGTALVGGKFAFGIGNPDITVPSAKSINDGAWHHCVATRERATGAVRVYVDGELQGSGIANRNTLNAGTHLVAGAIASGGGYFNGSLDDLRIFNRALTSNEVAALYGLNMGPPLSPPAGLRAVPGASVVELSWGEAPLATSYRVARSALSGGPYTVIASTDATSFRDITVLDNRTYHYVVAAENPMGSSGYSSEVVANPSPLAVWLKADAITGLTNGSPVGIWPDLSGRDVHAKQVVPANRPVFVTGAFNGMPAVRFNPASKSFLWMYRPVQDDFTLMVVFRSSQGFGAGGEFYSGAGLLDGECYGGVNDFGISLNAYGQILAGTGNPDRTIRSASGLADGRPHLVTFRRTRSNGLILLYIDGVQVGASYGGLQSLTAPNLLTLGAQQTLDNYFDGDVAEVRIYSTALTDIERVAIERSLKCKYGLGGGTTPPAPVGLTANVSGKQVGLSWMLSPGAASYEVWRSADSGATYKPIANGLADGTYLDLDVTRGFTYAYKVAAVNSCGTGVFSAPQNVPLPLPNLALQAGVESLSLSWPLWASEWTLQTTTNLAPPVNWSEVPGPAGTNSGQFHILLPISSSGSRFYRLASP